MSGAPTGVPVAVGLLAAPLCVVCGVVLPSWVGFLILVSAAFSSVRSTNWCACRSQLVGSAWRCRQSWMRRQLGGLFQ